MIRCNTVIRCSTVIRGGTEKLKNLTISKSLTFTLLSRSLILVLFLSLAFLSSCSGSRRQFQPGEIPQITDVSSTDEQYGHEVLNMMMAEYKLDRNDQNISRVRDIIEKLADSANSNAAPWHVYVFADDSVENAAATRGNYIFIWTGMLKRVKDDDELAAVLAHELAHVLAGHTQPTPAEEFTSMLSQVSAQVASEVLSSQGQIGIVANLVGTLTQALIGAIIVNPEEQRKELEADQIGLFLMAKAKYDPQKAVDFWQRMQTEGLGDMGPAQFFSSHPSSDERLEQLNILLPDAQLLRNGGAKAPKQDGGTGFSSEWTITTEEKTQTKKEPEKRSETTTTPRIETTPEERSAPSVPEPW